MEKQCDTAKENVAQVDQAELTAGIFASLKSDEKNNECFDCHKNDT